MVDAVIPKHLLQSQPVMGNEIGWWFENWGEVGSRTVVSMTTIATSDNCFWHDLFKP